MYTVDLIGIVQAQGLQPQLYMRTTHSSAARAGGECPNMQTCTGRTGRPLSLNRRRLDAVKPVATQHGQDGVPLGSVIETSAPATDFTAVGRRQLCYD
jgi:hypothetical protein